MMNTIKIGTRESKLALWQAEYVKKLLEQNYPDKRFVLAPMKTKGDKILDVPLPKIGDKGLFTKELEQALLSAEIDLAVHSLKDLPTQLSPGLECAAFCRREDPRDVFLSKNGTLLKDLPAGSVVATSSLRRKAQLKYYRSDLVFQDLRGNLETRWRKLQESTTIAGIVLAAAGVLRMGWQDRITEFIAEDVLLPAVGQGVIAVETASERVDIKELLKPLNHLETELAVRAERSFLRTLEGGCQVPIGALATVNNGLIALKGKVADLDGKVVLEISHQGQDPEKVGIEAAEKIIILGADEILQEMKRRQNVGK